MATRYPEHEKLKRVSHESQIVGEFLEWLEEGGVDRAPVQRRESYGSVELAFFPLFSNSDERSDRMAPLNWPMKKILGAYFEIDNDKIESEKMAMLEALNK